MSNLSEKTEALSLLEKGVYKALETYSNVHRGSGYKSIVTTHLYEKARDIVLDYLGLNKSKYIVVFCTARRARILSDLLPAESFQIVSSNDIGLSVGVRAMAIHKKFLPKGIPFQSGGGTTRIVSKEWVDWATAPDKFEAGTPAIINIITFAIALRIIMKFGNNVFQDIKSKKLSVNDFLYHDELDEFKGKGLLAELKKIIIGSKIIVPTTEGQIKFINLDNSASTPTFELVWNAYRESLNRSTQVQQEIIQEVKIICAKLLGTNLNEYEVIFTSNTTEAINLVAENLSFDEGNEKVVINSLLEHSSNDLPWRSVQNSSLLKLNIDEDGFFDLPELESLLRKFNAQGSQENKRVRIVAISGASNVLGVCNNISEISRIVHNYGAQLLVDAAQLIAHRKIDMNHGDSDYLTFSAHKLYAPFGCGVLLVKKDLLRFSTSERELIRVSGEENVAGIAALGKMSVLLQRIGMDYIQKEELALTAKALQALSQVPGLKIYGIKNHDHPKFDQKIGVIVFAMKGIMANSVAKKLTLQSGIGVRYGCHCAHILIKHLLNMSPGLEKFQRLILTVFPKMSLPGLTRVSLGLENSEEDIDKLVQALNQIKKRSGNSDNTYNNSLQILTKTEVQKQIKVLVSDTTLQVYSNI